MPGWIPEGASGNGPDQNPVIAGGWAVAPSDSSARMLDRQDECRALDELLEVARSGRSAAVVLRGEVGIGKTALLQYLLEHSTGCRTVRAVGVQSDMELSYAGLHQL